MTRRPLLLDLFCKAGGASMGYRRAGFEVIGVDIEPQPNYPFEFHQADALTLDPEWLTMFDIIAASPPCQRYSTTQRVQGRIHPDLIPPTRRLLVDVGRPYVIENVPGAPLHNPIKLCGAMFPELRTYRHRLFESSIPITAPQHPAHEAPVTKMGRPPKPDHFMHIVGNFSGVAEARQAMGVDWMTRDELRESIPPAYTEHIGRQLIDHLQAVAS